MALAFGADQSGRGDGVYSLPRVRERAWTAVNTKNTLVAVVHVHVNVESGGTWESAGMLRSYK